MKHCVYVVTTSEGPVSLYLECPMCKEQQKVTLTSDEWSKLVERRGLIQDILPNHSSDEREAIQTGICPICWDKLFKEPEDE